MMPKGKYLFSILLVSLLLGACSSGNSPDTESCPAWQLGDSMTYRTTETLNGVATETATTLRVTQRSNDEVVLSDDNITRSYTVVDGQYVPLTEQVGSDPADNYTSTTAFCPPPEIGEHYSYETLVAGPFPGSVESVTTTLTVADISLATVSVPAGDFAAKRITLNKTSSPGNATLDRYYAGGIGVVKEVEEIPATGTVITEELSAYSFAP